MITVAKQEDCTGCHGCASICPQACITMECDHEGFWYPVVAHEQCIGCGMCIEACPILQSPFEKKDYESNPSAYAAYNKDEAVRLKSSSGGIFTLIASEVLGAGGVVFGARFDDEFNVVHDYVEEIDGLDRFRGSKYVQSRIGESYRQVRWFLEQGRRVLFTGTPCQIGGVKRFLGNECDNLLCQDIICHGVPSPKVWKTYLSYREERARASALRIAFRRKDKGWKRYSVSFLFDNDTEYLETVHTDPYMRAFLRDICLRPSCHACRFKTVHRESDITLADFWGIESVLPEMDDDKGVSLVIVHSEKGQELLDQVHDRVVFEDIDIEKGLKHNSAMTCSVEKHPGRDEFFSCLDDEKIDQLIKRLCGDKFVVRLGRRIRAVARFVLQLHHYNNQRY